MENDQLALETYRTDLIGTEIKFRKYYYQKKFDTKQFIENIDYRIEDGRPVFELFVEDNYKGQILFRIVYHRTMERYHRMKTRKRNG